MPHTHHQAEARELLQEWLRRVHAASRVIDHETVTREDIRVAQERLAVHQGYLVELIAAGLASGRVLF